jgi:hypothetical protein
LGAALEVILHALVVFLQSLLKHHLMQHAALSLPALSGLEVQSLLKRLYSTRVRRQGQKLGCQASSLATIAI